MGKSEKKKNSDVVHWGLHRDSLKGGIGMKRGKERHIIEYFSLIVGDVGLLKMGWNRV